MTQRRVVPGDLSDGLIDASRRAYLVVVDEGWRIDGRRSVPLAEEVAAHASSPVLLVREGWRWVAGPILVGVDGSAASSTVFDANVEAAMVRLSGSAAMAVVCTRSHPRLSEFLLGSVTRALLRSARCPVAVVSPPAVS